MAQLMKRIANLKYPTEMIAKKLEVATVPE